MKNLSNRFLKKTRHFQTARFNPVSEHRWHRIFGCRFFLRPACRWPVRRRSIRHFSWALLRGNPDIRKVRIFRRSFQVLCGFWSPCSLLLPAIGCDTDRRKLHVGICRYRWATSVSHRVPVWHSPFVVIIGCYYRKWVYNVSKTIMSTALQVIFKH